MRNPQERLLDAIEAALDAAHTDRDVQHMQARDIDMRADAEAVVDALGMKQYGQGWHHNTFTGELEPIEDEGNHTRLYRLWNLDEGFA